MNEVAELFEPQTEETQEVSEELVEESAEDTNTEDVEKVEEADSKPEGEPEAEKPETTSEEEQEKQDWTFEAVKNLRKEKQELREQLEKLQADQVKEEPLPDIFDNQEEFVKSLRDQLKGETRQQIIQTQRDMMMEFKSDYEDKEKAFFEIAKDNPALISQANASPNPAKFAYDQGVKYLKYQEMQDVDSLEAKLRAELEQKIRSEYDLKSKEKTQKADNLSPSLANARGAVDKEESLPENPGDLFK